MSALLTQAIAGQFEAAFAMFNRCLEACPDEHWDALIAKYPFWQTAYHTLCFVDLYLSSGEKTWQPRTGPGGFHPRGWKPPGVDGTRRGVSQPSFYQG